MQLSPALEKVVTGYGAMVQAVGRRRGLDEADLDEIMQDVRIRIWKALGSSERIGQVNTSYVYQAAMSAVCDLIRRRRGDRTESIEEGGERAIVESGPGPDVGYERRELAQQVGRALDQLGADQRPVVRMYLAGYPQGEIQALLGWTEAKTRNVLYRGLAQLRLVLGRTGIGPHATR